MKPMKEIWENILVPSEPKAIEQDIAAFEQKLGFGLPPDYRSFLLECNGGTIRGYRVFAVPTVGETTVCNVASLSAKSPDMGIVEWRRVQEHFRQGLRQSIPIGDDGGTGFYFLILDGSEKGAVYFSYKDDLAMQDWEDWNSNRVKIPACMTKVASTFNDFGQMIYSSQIEED